MMPQAPTRLLLADDEDGIRLVLSVLLKDMGYEVTTAARGDEALALYKESRPAIVISDIKMPGMDGIALLQAIKALDPSAEVLLLTGHADMELAVAGLRHGAGDFLNKPVSDAALEVALERARQRIAMREALRRHTEELEELVALRTEELVRSERFAAVGESAAVLAHAIKNIAGALEGTMYVLEKGLELNRREYFEQGWQMIRGDVSRLRKLAVGLLDLGRTPDLDFRPVSPASPAREVVHSLEHRAEGAGVRLELIDEAGPEPFVMASEAVHQCLLNLVLNALEALFDDTVPGEGASGNPPHVRITVRRELRPDGGVQITYIVADNGPGLPSDTAEGRSRSFQSTKETGSGIGLFATRKIVHEMGAELSFSSSSGLGTEAVLRLKEHGNGELHP